MSRFNHFKCWMESHADVVLDFVRIYLGLGLLVKGIYFATHPESLADILQESGTLWLAPTAMAHYVISAHVAGGLFLAIGLLTRVAALVQIPILIVALFYVYLPDTVTLGARQNMEFSALVLFLLMLLFLYGGGRLSLDHYLERKPREIEQPRPA